jgi:hypothetical protein
MHQITHHFSSNEIQPNETKYGVGFWRPPARQNFLPFAARPTLSTDSALAKRANPNLGLTH